MSEYDYDDEELPPISVNFTETDELGVMPSAAEVAAERIRSGERDEEIKALRSENLEEISPLLEQEKELLKLAQAPQSSSKQKAPTGVALLLALRPHLPDAGGFLDPLLEQLKGMNAERQSAALRQMCRSAELLEINGSEWSELEAVGVAVVGLAAGGRRGNRLSQRLVARYKLELRAVPARAGTPSRALGAAAAAAVPRARTHPHCSRVLPDALKVQVALSRLELLGQR